MGTVDLDVGAEVVLTTRELVAAAQEMRATAITAIHAAGSGHPGGSLSIMDIAAALYLAVARHSPYHPSWEHRDRIYFSAGHKAPALYAALCRSGYFPVESVVTLRQYGSPFQGHPHRLDLPGVEASSGSLGQGLGIAVGSALASRLDDRDYRVYCLMGDGEQQEGSVWEAAMSAAQFKLDNLCAVVDTNGLQIDGKVKDVMNVESIAEKYRAFGWHVVEIDGHDMQQILDAFEEARETRRRPTCIVARTVKGKGVSFMENRAEWHGVATKTREELDKALADLAVPSFTKERVDALLAKAAAFKAQAVKEVAEGVPTYSRNYWWNSQQPPMQADMEPTRFGFGRALKKAGEDPRVVTLHADISKSICITEFEAGHPERQRRVFSVGIAEQNMMQVAVGLAKEGKIPVTGTYGVFASGRPWDQIRTSACYGRYGLKIGGAHGGVSVGADGATHQALEEISLMAVLPGMTLLVPCDAPETEKATLAGLLDVPGPVYLRFAREATPVVTRAETPFVLGQANVIRLRRAEARFIDAFETVLAADYRSENEALTLVACGPQVAEAMRAAWILKEEKGLETRILNVHTVKPMDREALARAARETGAILTAEEHQKGGFGNIVAGVLAQERSFRDPLVFDMLGVEDRFGGSGPPWELMKAFGLTAEHIAERAIRLLGRKG